MPLRMEAAGRPVLTVQQAMAKAGVSRRSLYHWMASGQIEYVCTAGGQRRIFEDTLFRRPPDRDPIVN